MEGRSLAQGRAALLNGGLEVYKEEGPQYLLIFDSERPRAKSEIIFNEYGSTRVMKQIWVSEV